MRVSCSSVLWQRPEVSCLQMSGDVILCRSFTRPSTTLAVMKAWERGYVHVIVLVVSFPYHGMGMRLSFCTSTPIPCFCSLVLGSPIQHVNPDAHTHTHLTGFTSPSLQVTKNTNSLKMQTQISLLCSYVNIIKSHY